MGEVTGRYKEFAQRLRQACAHADVPLQQKAVGKAFGVSGTMGWNYLNGEKMPGMFRGTEIATRLDVSFEWLMTGRGHMLAHKETLKAVGGLTVDALGHEFAAREYSFVPRYEAHPHAGAGGVAQEYDEVEQMLAFRTDWLRSKGLRAEDLTANIVHGNSMFPTLKDGDIVLTNRADREVEGGKIYSLNLDGRLLVKRLFLIPGGAGLRVSSDNKADPEYQDEVYTEAQLEQLPINIIGRVVWGAGDL